MAIDVSEFETIDDLDIHFKKQLRKAPDEEAEAAVRAEWNEGKVAFWQNQSQRQALAVAKRDALDKYPLAKEFAEDVRGASAAEIEASAKRFHERMEKVTKDADEAKAAATAKATDDAALARQQYGQPVGAGGGTPSRPAIEDAEALRERVLKRLQRGEGLQDSQGKMDSIRYQNMRLAEGVEASIHNPSYRSFSRQSPDDRKIQDDRTKRKGA